MRRREPSLVSRLSTRSARRTRDWIVLVALIAAQVSAQTPDSIEEVGQSPLYYRLPWVLPTGVFHGGPSLVVDAVSGATRWGFRVAGGVALALARDPHHVLAFELGYAYRGAEDHLGSAGISFLFTPTDQVKDWNFTPGAVLSLAAIGGARLAEPTFGLRVAVGLRWVYSFEVAWELLPSANAVTHVLALTLGSWLVAW